MCSTGWALRVTSGWSTSPGRQRRPASAGRESTASRPRTKMSDKNTPTIAFVGLGSMGLGMAKNLLKHGHRVFGVDPSQAARDAFSAAGGTVEATPAAAAAKADVVVVAV